MTPPSFRPFRHPPFRPFRVSASLIAVSLTLAAAVSASTPRADLLHWGAVTPVYLEQALASIASEASPWSPVPFCWRARADGGVRQNETCAQPLASGPVIACGLQNLGPTGAWDPAVLDADAAEIARAFAARSEPWGCAWAVLDIENLAASERDRFTAWTAAFTRAWKQARGAGSGVSVALHAKVAEPGNWSGAQAQHWAGLCAAADELTIMAYDFTVPGDGAAAGETAPIAWVRDVLLFATHQCPPAKLRLGLAAYGHRWPPAAPAVVTEREWLAESGGSPSAPNPDFVETAAQRAQKEKAAAEFGVTRTFLWALGMEAL